MADRYVVDKPKPAGARRRFGSLDARGIALIVLILILVYQVVVPIGMIVWTSLKEVRPGDPNFLSLSFSIGNYIKAFGSQFFWETTLDTLIFSVASTALSFAMGAFLAWVVHRTDTPLSGLIGALLVARIIIPGILITISWILLASPTIGIANFLLGKLTGISSILNIYSMGGLIWIQSIEMVPLSYLLLSSSFQSMDPRLEEASIMTGANTFKTLRKIVFPLAWPAIAASLLLMFITTIETFEVPLLVGGRAGVRVFTTEIYLNTARTPTDWGLASSYSTALLVMCVGLLFLYFRLLRNSERYQTITGKDFRPRRTPLGWWRYITLAVSLLIVLFVTGIPFLMMVYLSLLPRFQPPSATAFSNMSLEHFTSLFSRYDVALQPLVNSTILGLGTAFVLVILAAAIAYFVQKTKIPGRRALDFLAFSSIAIPSVVLGAAFFWFYLLVPLPIQGTLVIIGMAYITKYLPYALRFVSTSMMQIHSELEEAAQVTGARWWRNFTRIYLPLLKPGLLAAWIWVMMHAFRELTVALMLGRTDNRTAAVIIFDYWENGSFMKLSAFGVIMFVLLIGLLLISQALSRRYGVQEQH